MARRKLVWRLCWPIAVSRRESDPSCFVSLQTIFDGDKDGDDCAPGPLVDVGLAPFVADDGEAPPDGDVPAPKFVWPVMSAGDARLDTGGPGKT